MANPKHLDILKQGVDAWNAWRENNSESRPDLRGADLSRTDLKNVNLVEADLKTANFRDAYLSQALFRGADLEKAILFGANLFESDLRACRLTEADLRNAVLIGANLKKADLSGAVLSEADLRRADLRGANLQRANLRGDHLMGDRLRRTDLRGADLGGADLSGADLRRANLKGNYFKTVNLKDTVFKNSLMHDTILSNNDLSIAEDLDSVIHYGPSSIGIDTVARSKGNIPEPFLRGCGLTEWEIVQARLYQEDLSNNEIIDIHNSIFAVKSPGDHPYNSCVIRHSKEDEDFAKSLHENLQNAGVRCWTNPEGIKQYVDATDHQDKRLLILSDHSMSSAWIRFEIKRTRMREKVEDRQILFPIRLVALDVLSGWELRDRETAADLAAAVRSYDVSDFSRWKEEGFSKGAFEKLLHALKI